MDVDSLTKQTADLGIRCEKELKPGTSHYVYVTHVNNPLNFYVRLTKHDPFMKRLEKDVPTEKVGQVFMHQRVLYNLSNDSTSKYLRCQITDIRCQETEITCNLFAIDYGYGIEAIPLSEIWKCHESITQIVPLARECQLHNCVPIDDNGWSEEAVTATEEYFGSKRARMIITGRISYILIVKMKNLRPDDIVKFLFMKGFCGVKSSNALVTNDQLPAVPTQTEYKYKTLSVNDTIHVRMQHGISLSEFYVIAITDYWTYLRNRVLASCKIYDTRHVSIEELKQDLPVCVFDAMEVCDRAVIKSVIPNEPQAVVQLVDFGLTTDAHINHMRYLPEECLTSEACAIFCSAPPNDALDMETFLSTGHQFIITIKELGHQLDSPNIVTITELDTEDELSNCEI